MKKIITQSLLPELEKSLSLLSCAASVNSTTKGDGSKENPYSWEEFLALPDPPQAVEVYYRDRNGVIHYAVIGSNVICSRYENSNYEDDYDPFDNSFFDGYSDYYFNSDYDNIIDDDANSGNRTNTNTYTNNGNSSSESSTGSGVASSTNFNDVLSKSSFKGYKSSDPRGCLNRCKEMLSTANCSLNGIEILMCTSTSDGRPRELASTYFECLAYIEECLRNGYPVVVCVDYHSGQSTGKERSDQAGDHFVVIVGGNRYKGFHYYDPATSSQDRGTSTNNIFYEENGWLRSTNICTGTTRYYTITSVRKLNK